MSTERPARDRLRALKRLDASLTRALREFPLRRAFRLLLSIIAHSADSLVLIPCLALTWWLEGLRWPSLSPAVAATYGLSVVITSIVKYAVRRRRPPGEWGGFYRRTDPHSFPSGHASRTAAMTLTVLLAGDFPIGAALLVWSLLVGLARIILGVHYLMDVLAGYLLGLALAAGLWLLPALGILTWAPR